MLAMLNWELLYSLLTSSYKQRCELALIVVPHKGLTTPRGCNFSDHFSLKKNGKTVIFARHYRMIRVMTLKVCFKIHTGIFARSGGLSKLVCAAQLRLHHSTKYMRVCIIPRQIHNPGNKPYSFKRILMLHV